jgi:hypothetical protein
MSKISRQKQEKIMANIISILYEHSPEALFTSHIAKIEGRDEEFTKTLLLELKIKGLVYEVNKNPKGIQYTKRQRWRLSNKTFEAYNNSQS